MKRRTSARFAAVLGIVAIAVILGGVALLTALNLQKTSSDLDELARTTALGDAYSRTTIAIALASVHGDEFQRTGDPLAQGRLIAQIRESMAQLERAKALATESERADLVAIEQRFSSEVASAMTLLSGGSLAQDPDGGGGLVLDEITKAFNQPGAEARERSAAGLTDFRDSVKRRSSVALIAFLAALPVLGLLFFLILLYERTEAIRAAEVRKLGEAVLTDGLTGLRNHRAFQEDLRQHVALAARIEQSLTVAMIDIDDFKEINDTQGHGRGDVVLSQLGRLMRMMRSGDSAYRVGGDEFAIILPDTNVESAYVVVDRLRQTVASALSGVTISVGLSSPHGAMTPAAKLRDQADTALYEAKHRGKNQAVIYTGEVEGSNEVTAAKMSALREVLKNNSMEIWFQPIYRVGSLDMLAFEALLRLPGTPEISGPEEAFEIAQRMGRSRDLDLACAERALDGAVRLTGEQKIFINLDPATLMHSDFTVDELVALTEKRGISPSTVVFEITEKTTVSLSRLTRQVSALQDAGYGVALDDVGSGNSGLEMLRLMRFDYVKIDRSVILDAMDGGPGRAVILAIVAFARETGAYIIAEGIETRPMLDSVKLDEAGLHKFWIQAVQGFFLGEPRPAMSDFDPAKTSAA